MRMRIGEPVAWQAVSEGEGRPMVIQRGGETVIGNKGVPEILGRVPHQPELPFLRAGRQRLFDPAGSQIGKTATFRGNQDLD